VCRTKLAGSRWVWTGTEIKDVLCFVRITSCLRGRLPASFIMGLRKANWMYQRVMYGWPMGAVQLRHAVWHSIPRVILKEETDSYQGASFSRAEKMLKNEWALAPAPLC
jgi:hypothetical protein